MRKFTNSDKTLYQELLDACNDKKIQTVLIRGFDDDDKLIISLLSALEFSHKNMIRLRVNAYQHVQSLVKRAINKYQNNTKVSFNSKKPAIIFGKSVPVDRWDQNKYLPINDDVSIYFPIQTVIAEGKTKKFTDLTEALSRDHSKLKILITTNDVNEDYLDISLLDDIVDKYLVLDSSKKFPERYATILKNIEKSKIHYEID